MRNLFVFFGVFTLLLNSCDHNTQESPFNNTCKTDSLFTICSDTLVSKLNGTLSASMKFDNTYLTFIENIDPRTNREVKRLFQLSEKGKIIHELEIPKEVHNWHYYDFIYLNDSVYISNQFDVTFLLVNIQK